MQLRDYQQTVADEVVRIVAEEPDASPLIVSGTGTGKTVLMAWLVEYYGRTAYQACIAHRRELVSQIARDLARRGIKHRIVGPATTVAECRRAQLEELGYHHVDQTAKVGVCSVDTLVARDLSADTWARSVTHCHWDEAHHCTVGGLKWDKARTVSFPSLRHSIGYTATPRRADRKPLRGFFTHMVEAPPMWQQIENGYLTPYKMVMREITDVDLSVIPLSANGDLNPQAMRKTVKQSRKLVGNAVEIYKQYTPGKKAVLFAADIEHATQFKHGFNAAGISAEIVTADTKEEIRRDVMKRFRNGQLQVLMNVDLFGEGFDLPAIEVVIMCRPTKSLPLYQQQFGRALRLMVDKALMKQWHTFTPEQRKAHIAASAKPHAWIFDLVANCLEPACGGLPDARGRVWSLDGAKKSDAGPKEVPENRACTNPYPLEDWNNYGPVQRAELNQPGRKDYESLKPGAMCTGFYERFRTACPECGWSPIPAGRTIEQVDGDVTLVDDETLAKLRGEYLEAHTTPHYGGPHAAANYARHRERFEALSGVREAIEWWGPAYEIEQGRKLTDREQMKAFYLTFGVTTLEAVSLRRAEAETLRKKVLDWMELKGFTIPA